MKDLKIRMMLTGVDRVSSVLGGVGAASQKAGRSVAEATKLLKSQQKELRSVDREIQSGSGNVTELVNRERQLSAAIEHGTRELEQRQATLDRLNAANKRFQKTQATGDRMISSGGRAIAAGAVIGAGAASGVKGAMGLEDEMAGVAKVTNMAAPDISKMSGDLLDMSTRIPIAAEGMAKIAAAAGAAGVGANMKDQRQQLIAFTEDAAKMGIAFDMTAEDAGSTMAKWRTAFKMTQPEVASLGDKINALTNTLGGKASDVSDIVTRIGPLGKVAGLAAPQIAALGSTLNSIGVENEVAATGIKNMMLSLTKGTAATKGQMAAFKALGLSSTQVAKDMQTNGAGTIVDVMKRIGKLKPEQQASMLSELFGTESVGAIAPMLTSLDKVQQALGIVGDKSRYAGSMQKEFLSKISTTKGATGLAMNALSALNIEMGQKLLPYVTTAAKKITEVAGSMRAWGKAHPEAANGIMKVAGGLAMLLVSLGGFGVAAGVSLKAWGFIRAGATLAGGPLKIMPKLFGIVRTAATLMGGGLVKAGGVMLRYLPMVFGAIRTGALFMARGVVQAGAMMLANPMVLAIVAIGAAIGLVAYLVYTHWDTIKQSFERGIAAASSMLNGWGAGIASAWQTVKNYFAAGVTAIGAIFSGIGARLAGAWQGIRGAVSTGLTMLQNLVPGFKNIGAMMLEGLLSMLSPGRLIRHIASMGLGAIATFKRVLGIQSPSRVFAEMGGHLSGGLALGIDRSADVPINRTRRLAGQMAAAMAVGAVPAAAFAAGATPAGGKAGARGSAGAAHGVSFGGDTIHIHLPAGSDEAQARKIEAILNQRDREKAARARASFSDRGD
jgi:TP901 family phage tail tape measure protein